MHRREFLKACTAAGVFLPGSPLGRLAFAADGPPSPLTVVVFLRGGCDGLNLVAPCNDPAYIEARPTELRLLDSGERTALPLDNPLGSGLDFRLHPDAKPIHDLYKGGQMVVLHACGLMNATRSHFEAQDLIEKGIANSQTSTPVGSGWLTRYLETLPGSPATALPAMAASSGIPASLSKQDDALAIPNFRDGLSAPGGTDSSSVLSRLYAGGRTEAHLAGTRTLKSLALVDARLPHQADGRIAAYASTAPYEDNAFTQGLQAIARVARTDLGLRIAHIDHSNWDTHEGQQGRFSYLTTQLCRGLAAFHADMSSTNQPFRIIVMTEFGRRLRSNLSQGTDHGHGSVMLALGSDIQGGRMLGKWPGLQSPDLDRGVDLAATLDNRQVISELLQIGARAQVKIFPGLQPGKSLDLLRTT